MGRVECGGVVVGVRVSVVVGVRVSVVSELGCSEWDLAGGLVILKWQSQMGILKWQSQMGRSMGQEGAGTSASGSGRLPWVTLTLPGHSFGLEILT
jgi:hypothetical protein